MYDFKIVQSILQIAQIDKFFDWCIAAFVGPATELVHTDCSFAVEVAVGEGQCTSAATVTGTARGDCFVMCVCVTSCIIVRMMLYVKGKINYCTLCVVKVDVVYVM